MYRHGPIFGCKTKVCFLPYGRADWSYASSVLRKPHLGATIPSFSLFKVGGEPEDTGKPSNAELIQIFIAPPTFLPHCPGRT